MTLLSGSTIQCTCVADTKVTPPRCIPPTEPSCKGPPRLETVQSVRCSPQSLWQVGPLILTSCIVLYNFYINIRSCLS